MFKYIKIYFRVIVSSNIFFLKENVYLTGGNLRTAITNMGSWVPSFAYALTKFMAILREDVAS